MNKDIHSVSDFRAHANSLLKQIKQTKRPLELTRHGKSTAVVLEVSGYENLLQEIELLREDINRRNGDPHEKPC